MSYGPDDFDEEFDDFDEEELCENCCEYEIDPDCENNYCWECCDNLCN